MAQKKHSRTNDGLVEGYPNAATPHEGCGASSKTMGGSDRLILAIEAALLAGRRVRLQLRDSVIPALPTARRTLAERLIREIEQDTFFSERALQDIDAFVAAVESEVAANTKMGWEADDNHVRGGYQISHRDERTRTIAAVLPDVQGLRTAIAHALDGARSGKIAMTLLAG